MQVGINSNADIQYTPAIIGRLGARVVRVEWTIGTPVDQMRATIAEFAANGARVVPLATFWARTPTQAEARSVAAWAREFGPSGAFWRGRPDGHLAVREIEFGNETSYQYQYGDTWADASYAARAREYGLRARDAADALAGTGVGLLVQADDGGTRSSNWVNGMFAAVPDLDARVAGWSVHAYGPGWQDKLDRLVAQTRAAGASGAVPLHLTEWGLATDGGRCLNDNYGWNRCMRFDEAAHTLEGVVSALRSRYGSRLRSLLVYQNSDQRPSGATNEREHYFGALRQDGTDKGAYTAVLRRLFAG